MDTRVLVSVVLNNEYYKSGLELKYAKAIGVLTDLYHPNYINRADLIGKLILSSSDYFVYVKYANVMNLATFEFEVMSIEDCIRYNVIGLELDPSDLCDDGSIPINIFGYSKSLCCSSNKGGCIPFMYDGKPIEIGFRFSKSLLYYYITYGELDLELHINIENNTFKLGDFLQTDGFKDRDDCKYQWYGKEIVVDSLCGIDLYNQYCAYGYGVCIIDSLIDDIIVPNGIKEVRVLYRALSRSKTIVLPVSIDSILVIHSNTLYKYSKNRNGKIKATIIVSNSIKDETLIEMARYIIGSIDDNNLGISVYDVNDMDSAINFIRKTICNLEFY